MTCPECKGHGTVESTIGGDGYGDRCCGLADVEVYCSECGGEGLVPNPDCPSCHGCGLEADPSGDGRSVPVTCRCVEG